MAEVDGAVVGFALWFYTFSTFRGRHGLYLEDLFVRPEARRAGAGTALLRRLARRCVDEGLGRFEWSVLDWNEPAIAFYHAKGARLLVDWTMCRVDGGAGSACRHGGRMRVSLIAAVAANGVIGDGKGMPWRLSTDMKRFKALTMGKPVVVGRRTFETFGKPLPGRTNIVVTRQVDYRPEGVAVAASLREALDRAREVAEASGADEVMVLGGGAIYAAAIGHADRLYITHVAAEPTGSICFPAIDPAVWWAVSREPVAAGEKDSAATVFTVYERLRPGETG